VRLQRLEARASFDDAERMALQATDEERAKVATWILDNSGDVADLERQIDAIWPELLERASANGTT
jgi:dephospho-CoA kinase